MNSIASFRVKDQNQTEWCWAAMATSIEHLFFPGSTRTQCKTVSDNLGFSCCTQPLAGTLLNSCNRPHSLHEPLQKLGRLAAPPLLQPARFQDIKDEIDQGRPVPLLVKWRRVEDGSISNLGHFFAIWGYFFTPLGREMLMIQDSKFDDFEAPYDVFSSNAPGLGVRDLPGGLKGVWIATFKVRSDRAPGGLP